jgi:hypothetical protein
MQILSPGFQKLSLCPSYTLQTVFSRMQSAFGGNLQICRLDQEWLSVKVLHLTPFNLFQMLMSREREFFPQGTDNLAILCSLTPGKDPEIHVHDLSRTGLKDAFMSGFCYF